MTAMIAGQLDLLELLEPPKPKHPPYDPWRCVDRREDGSCAGCGHPLGNDDGQYASINHSRQSESDTAGHTVCMSMSLLRNHLMYYLRSATDQSPVAGDHAPQCCYESGSLHGKRVKNPTREQWLDHARDAWARAAESWALHPGSLAGIVRDVCLELGIDPAEVMHP